MFLAAIGWFFLQAMPNGWGLWTDRLNIVTCPAGVEPPDASCKVVIDGSKP